MASTRDRSAVQNLSGDAKARDAALEMAIAQIEKAHGRGAIMRLGESPHLDLETVSTGSLALDLALGVGGLPRGRIVEIYGPEGSGKCLTANTYLWTDAGLETVAELFARCGQPLDGAARLTDVSGWGVRAVNERGELETIAALTHNGHRLVVRLTLRSGRAITATHNHPLRVIDEHGCIAWREAGAVVPGDTVVSALFGAEEAAAGDWLSEDEAVFLGYLVARGSLAPAALPPEAEAELGAVAEALLAGDAEASFEEHAQGYGLEPLATGRAVPHRLRTAGHKAQRAFLSALFEGAGWIGAGTIGLCGSERLTREVQLLLYGLGVPARCVAPGDGRGRWSVAIERAHVRGFLAEVGFRSARRGLQAEACSSGEHEAPDRRPGLAHTYETVVAVEEAGIEPTFDVVLPRTHSFIANGILSHNTTVSLHVIAEAQKNGGLVGFIDAEHALDPAYAKAVGVDIDNLLVSQPDSGEQALEIADTLVRSGAMDVIVVDSVAALVPRAEIEGEMGDAHVGLQARLMSQALRKLAGNVNRTKTILIFINQLREKIGVMFGCFSYSTRVTLADGSKERIGKIVKQKLPVEVLSYDFESGRVEPRRVVNWFNNGKTDSFLEVRVARPGGEARFAATPNHLVRTPDGWVEAKDLEPGARLMLAVPERLSDLQWEVIRGSLLGRGVLTGPRGKALGAGAGLRLYHGAAQAAYLEWKAGLLANLPQRFITGPKGGVSLVVEPLSELAELHRAVRRPDGRKELSWDELKALTPLSLAIWYLDAGHLDTRAGQADARIRIAVQRLSEATRARLAEHLRDTWGLDVRLGSFRGQAAILLSETAAEGFQALIASCVPACMQHLLLPAWRGRCEVEPRFAEPRLVLYPCPVLDVRPKLLRRAMDRFDIEVEGNHNYFVDGVMVHNSPETTPGGRALKFYSSVRLDVRRIDSLKDGAEIVGARVRVKVVKNKVSSPFRTAEFDIQYGSGISKEGSLLDVAIEHGIVRKSGAWFIYGDDQLGQGRENAKAFLCENPDIATEIELKIKDKLGLLGGDEAAVADGPEA